MSGRAQEVSTLDAWLDGVRRFVAEGEFDFFLNLNDSDYPVPHQSGHEFYVELGAVKKCKVCKCCSS